MYMYMQELFHYLNANNNPIIIMVVYLGLLALTVLLRITACSAHRSMLFTFRINAKDITSRDDIKKIRFGLLRRIVAEFIRVADRGVTRIPTAALVARQVDGMSFFGWRYVSIMTMVESLESGLVFVGLILAVVFNDYAFVYGALAAAGFLLTRLAAGFFDYKAARAQLLDELIIYVEREIGRFFMADSGGAIMRLKSELSEAITHQSATLTTAVGQIGEKMAEAVERKLLDTDRLQEAVHAAAASMQTAGAGVLSASEVLAKQLQGSDRVLAERLHALITAAEALQSNQAQLGAEVDALRQQSRYIERNQTTLDTSIQAYETSLQQLTQSLGDGLGAYTRLHAQSTAQAIGDALTDHMNKIANANQDTLRHMETVFDQLRDQSKDLSAHLLAVHEKLARLERRAQDGTS